MASEYKLKAVGSGSNLWLPDDFSFNVSGKDAPASPVLNISVPNYGVTTGPWQEIGGGFGWGFGGNSGAGVNVTAITALQSTAVYACVKILSNDVAKLPLRLMKLVGNSWVPQPQHPLSKLLLAPNKRMTTYQLKQHLAISRLLTGNGFAVIIRDEGGNPEKLIPLSPGMVSVTELPDGDIIYSATSTLFVGLKTSIPYQKGQTRRILQEDMIHYRDISLDTGLLGYGAIGLASEAVGLTIAGQQLAANTFANGASFQAVLTNPNNLKKEQAQQIMAAFNEAQAGVRNAGKVPLLAGGTEIHNLSMSPLEAQLLESRKHQIEEVARMFGVPPHKLGLLDGAKYNNIEQQNQSYIDDSLIPLTKPLEELLNNTLLFDHQIGRYKFEFNFDELLKSDTATRYANWQTAQLNGWVTRKFVCEQEGLPIPTDPEAELYSTMMNTGVVGDTKPKDVGSGGSSGIDDAGSNAASEGKEDEDPV